MPTYLEGYAAVSSPVDWQAAGPCKAVSYSKGPRLRLLHEANIERDLSKSTCMMVEIILLR